MTHVGDLTGAVDPLVDVGDGVEIRIGYDPDTPEFFPYVSDPTRAAYFSPGYLVITVNGLVFAMDFVQVDVIDWPDQDLFDVLAGTLVSGTPPAMWPAGIPIFENTGAGFAIIDTTPPLDLLSGDALPTSRLRPRLDDVAGGNIVGATRDLTMYEIQFAVDVPEPGSTALAGLGIAWALARRRRQ